MAEESIASVRKPTVEELAKDLISLRNQFNETYSKLISSPGVSVDLEINSRSGIRIVRLTKNLL